MKFSEIFEKDDRRRAADVAHLSLRYGSFKALFGEFASGAAGAGNKPAALENYGIEPHLDRDFFIVHFAGKQLRFLLVMVENGGRGEIVCHAAFDHYPDNHRQAVEWQEITRFRFTGEGVTDLVESGPKQDPMILTANWVPAAIIYTCIRQAFA